MSSLERSALPPAELRYRHRVNPKRAIRELWRSRELIRTLVERDLRARYKEAVLGFTWAIVTPLVLMVVFSVFLRRVADIDTDGIPYPVFSYVALVPWTFFSSAVSAGSLSMRTNSSLLTKVACPREVFPLATTATAAVDATISTLILGLLFVIFGVVPQPTTYWVPLLLAIQVSFTLGVVLILSGILVYLRDLRHALPLILQLGLFATPVAYGMKAIPTNLRTVYSAVNPLGPVIDGYRRSMLYGQPPDWDLLLPAALSAVAVLLVGYTLFKRWEVGFADLV